MKDFILKLVEDYNNYSELVALNCSKMKEGECDKNTLQWNRGHLDQIELYLLDTVKITDGVRLEWEYGEHEFGCDNWKRKLTYKTVCAVFGN